VISISSNVGSAETFTLEKSTLWTSDWMRGAEMQPINVEKSDLIIEEI